MFIFFHPVKVLFDYLRNRFIILFEKFKMIFCRHFLSAEVKCLSVSLQRCPLVHLFTITQLDVFIWFP